MRRAVRIKVVVRNSGQGERRLEALTEGRGGVRVIALEPVDELQESPLRNSAVGATAGAVDGGITRVILGQ
jgi:hypothetical protein